MKIVVMSVFIPGLPKDAKFDKTTCFGCCNKEDEWESEDEIELQPMEEGKRRSSNAHEQEKESEEEEEKEGDEESQDKTYSNKNEEIRNKRRSKRKSDDRVKSVDLGTMSRKLSVRHKKYLSEEIDRRDIILDDAEFSQIGHEMPSFMTIIYMVILDLFKCSFKTLRMYFYCLGWKFKCLFKLTIGYWDDELLRGMQIQKKAEIFDEDLDDDIEHHDDMIRLKGQAHSLIWQFSSILVILAKMSEAINESPLYIKADEEKIVVDPICETKELDENMSMFDKCTTRLYNFFTGRIALFVYSMLGLITAVILVLYPNVTVIVFYLMFMLPDRCVRVAKKAGTMKHKFPHLTKVKNWLC